MDFRNVALAVGATVVSLLAGIAVAGYLTVGHPQLITDGDGILAYDPEIGMAPRPAGYTKRTDGPTPNRPPLVYDIYTDGRGARVDGRDQQRSPARSEIVTIGCSFTWGHPISSADTYASRLRRDLGVTVSNFSMASYGTTQSLQLLRRNRDLAPKLVIYGFIYAHLDRNVRGCAPSYLPFCLDVAHVTWDEAGKPYIAPPLSNGVRRLQRQLTHDYWNPVTWVAHGVDVVYGRLALAWDNNRAPDATKPEGALKREEAFAFLFGELQRTVADMGAELLVVHIPTAFEAAPPELARSIGKARFLDLTPAFNRHKDSGGPRLHVIDDGHPNELGHKLIADEIAAYVRKEGLLERSR